MKSRGDPARLCVAPPPLHVGIPPPAAWGITLYGGLARKVIVIGPASQLGVAAPDYLARLPAPVSYALR